VVETIRSPAAHTNLALARSRRNREILNIQICNDAG
jgi:hypothetical protein